MQDYIFSVISFSAVGTVALGLLPLGGEALKKAFTLLLSVIMILIVGEPILSFIKSYDGELNYDLSGTEYSSYEEVWLETLENITQNDADDAVFRLISEKYSLGEDEVSVECILKREGDTFSFEKVNVSLSGKGNFINPGRIENFLNEKLGCECIVK